ncbi:MAG TPA: haloperoxidase, partial [Candidatus Dormibacteraeota bacterium]
MRKGLVALTALLAAAAVATGALSLQHSSASAAATPRPSGSIVIEWNRELVNLVNTPGNQPTTIHPTRSFAILHTAIYDAVISSSHR